MKKTSLVSMILLLLGFLTLSCGKLNNSGSGAGSGSGNSDGGSTKPYTAHWLSDCVDLGVGNKSRIYMEIEKDLKINLAYLTYAGASCTGAHTLQDALGNPVTEAQYAQNFSEEAVTDIPDNFFTLKITTVSNSSVQYAILFVNDAELFELTGFVTPHATWTQWQGEADVFQFAANPTTYTPTTFKKYHFTKSNLP